MKIQALEVRVRDFPVVGKIGLGRRLHPAQAVRMKRTPCPAMVLALLACSALSGEAPWQSLFNGRDLAGWQVTGRPADVLKGFWRVADGAIEANSLGQKGHDYVWLLSEREYGDFELEFRFQAFRDSPGNSGVQLRSRYDGEAFFLDGPQIDIHPPAPWRTGMIWDETRGSSRWLWPPVEKGKWVDESMAASNRVWRFSDEGDGWNLMQVRARGTHLRAVLNGVVLMEWDGAGVLDDAVHRQRKVGLRGHVALQIHRNDALRIRFKDIRVRELTEAGSR